MPGGGDVPKPCGLYSYALIEDMWPTESESALGNTAERLQQLAQNHESAADSATAQSDAVFAGDWTGAGAAAAEIHYRSERGKHLRLAALLQEGAGGVRRLGEDVGRIKTKMRDAHDAAHQEIETLLEIERRHARWRRSQS